MGRVFSQKHKYSEYIFIGITVLIFIFVAGLRSNIGDTSVYVEQYTNLVNFNGELEGKDKGFTVFILILYNICTDPQFMIFVTAFITQVYNFITMYKYKSYFELESYMYIASGSYLVTMNGIRQALAGAVMFAYTHLIIKGKFIPYLLIVLLMSTVHNSALIMIPVYFIVRQEAWSKNTFIIIGLSSIGFLFFYQLVPIMMDILGNSTYTEYEEALLIAGQGSSFMRVLVYAVPVILSYWHRDRIKEMWPESNVFINMSLLNLIVITFSLYNWIFARFSIYFQMYNFILLPFIIKNCFKRRQERDLIYYLFLICYFIFFYREQVIGMGIVYKSNFLNF